MITVGGMSSMEINPPNHVRINQTTDRTIPSIFLSQGFAADALSPASARDVNLVSWDRSDKQPTAYQWNLNVQRELPARWSSRSATTPTGSSTTGDRSTATRRRPGLATSIAGACSDGGGAADGRRHHARERHAHPEGRLEPLSRAADQGREALREGRVAAGRVHLVADARPRGRLPGLQQHRRRDRRRPPPIARTTSSAAACASCRSAATARLAATGAA